MSSRRTATRRILVATAATSALLGAATVPAFASPPVSAGHAYGHVEGGARLDYQKTVAVRVLKEAFERGDAAVVDRFVRADYIQHNPLASDGAEALKNFAVGLHQQFPDTKYDVKRVISEG
ncbi:MAG: SnoaL-like domain-containing protein, partial [Streptomyces sp.]|nr:SnoaL-like domain-containing protein [Streptomyces sp.]